VLILSETINLSKDDGDDETQKGNLSYSPSVGQDLASIKLLFAPADRVGFLLFSANRPRLAVSQDRHCSQCFGL